MVTELDGIVCNLKGEKLTQDILDEIISLIKKRLFYCGFIYPNIILCSSYDLDLTIPNDIKFVKDKFCGEDVYLLTIEVVNTTETISPSNDFNLLRWALTKDDLPLMIKMPWAQAKITNGRYGNRKR